VSEPILTAVERYYSGRFAEHGPTARGVDWNSEESQELRFAQLLKVCDDSNRAFSLIDYGCGYGALARYLERQEFDASYVGFDVSSSMLDHARCEHGHAPRVIFVARADELHPADYTVASGIFNVKLDVENSRWRKYVLEQLEMLAHLSLRGFAFNMLSSYSDTDKMRPDLYYGDPSFFFDLCKRRYARNVALLHDYGLYEFTMIVRLGE